jgi:murein DD-endopeptidase MepM/ murein hydrolase activator NlpD
MFSHKLLVIGISAILLIPLAPIIDWVYYHDRKPFVPPIRYTGELPIRNDSYGDGRFGASRKGGRLHKGLDILGSLKSQVFAVKGGSAKTGFSKNGMGKYVIITHTEGFVTLYGHLSELCVKEGDRTRQGAVIGYVGKTGNARYKKIKPHLHFEVRRNGEYLDPLLFLK